MLQGRRRLPFGANISVLALTLSNALFFADIALAQTAAPAAGGPPAAPGFAEVMIQMLPMFVAVFFVFHLLVTRPQQQKLREQQKLLDGLKRGDSVLTSGGILGRISAIEKDHVLLEIAQNVRVKCTLSAITKREDLKSDSSKGNKE